MSQPKLLLMSQRERDRLKVLPEVPQGQLRQKQAALAGADGALGAEVAARRRRPRDRASVAVATVEPSVAGGVAGAGGHPGERLLLALQNYEPVLLLFEGFLHLADYPFQLA